MKTLVDTSAWVEFFNHGDSPLAGKVAALIADDDAVICGLVRCEILVGFKSEASFNEARNILEEFVSIDDSSSSVRNAAVDIYRACRKSGLTIRSLVDCMIAAAAMLSDLPILARDRDFEAIARLHPIELAP